MKNVFLNLFDSSSRLPRWATISKTQALHTQSPHENMVSSTGLGDHPERQFVPSIRVLSAVFDALQGSILV